ncbi:MAG: GGDEF domain-containing protein [Giesbergeria sp.]
MIATTTPPPPAASAHVPISVWRAEFKDADCEQAFRASVQDAMARQLRLALALWAGLMLLFALPDLQALGAGNALFWQLLSYRALMAMLLLGAIWVLRSQPRWATDGRLVAWIAVIGYPFYFLLFHVREDVRFWTVGMVMFMQFCMFLFLPGRVVAYLPVAVWGVVGSLLSFVLLGRPTGVLLGLVFLLTLPALVGYMTAARLQRVQRQEFALRQRLSETNAALQTEIAQRIELQAELERQATTDPLTGLVNRREFSRRFALDLARTQRDASPLSLVLIDLDHFKRINDQYGHAAGDAVLRTLAQLSHGCFRSIDTVGRLGGEEFAVLLPSADLHCAAQAARRLAQRLADTPVEHEGQRIVAGMTAGVAQRLPGEESLESLLQRADLALYAGKQAGRARTMLALPDGSHQEFYTGLHSIG